MTRWVAAELGPTCRSTSRRSTPTSGCSTGRRRRPPPSLRARRIALGNGLSYVYTGNVHDEDGGSTYCPGCGERLIGRDWFVLTDWNLTPDGACATCGTPCAGRFAGGSGHLGLAPAAGAAAGFRGGRGEGGERVGAADSLTPGE